MRAQAPRGRRGALTPRRAVAVTCGAKQCDMEANYHADCLTAIYEKLGPKSSGAAKNRALAHSIENLRFSGARLLRRCSPAASRCHELAAGCRRRADCAWRDRLHLRAPRACAPKRAGPRVRGAHRELDAADAQEESGAAAAAARRRSPRKGGDAAAC